MPFPFYFIHAILLMKSSERISGTMPNYDHLGEIFREFRTNRNISLKQIADNTVSASQISRFERGETDISLSRFLRVLDNMHVEMNEFMAAVRGNLNTKETRPVFSAFTTSRKKNMKKSLPSISII